MAKFGFHNISHWFHLLPRWMRIAGLFCCLLVWVLFLAVLRTDAIVREVLRRTGTPVYFYDLHWAGAASLEASQVSIAEYARAQHLTVRWNWWDLLVHQRIGLVDLTEPEFWTSGLDQHTQSTGRNPMIVLEIGKLRITDGYLFVDNIGPGIPAIPIRVGQDTPLEINNIYLGKPTQGAAARELQTATVQGLTIRSFVDPLVPVLSFDKITIQFSWEGLSQDRIESLLVEGPRVYIGPHLFWFSDEWQKLKPTAKEGKTGSWKLQKLDVSNGHLTISAFGEPGLPMPFTFSIHSKDVDLGDLSKLSLHNEIVVEPQDLNYPEYSIAVKNLHGQVQFKLPLSDTRANNVVPTVFLDEVTWKKISATQVWSSVTFDRKGIYGRLGGASYQGYISGGFSILFDAGFPWQGWIDLNNVSAQELAAKVVPEDFSITGKFKGRINVKGQAKELSTGAGSLSLLSPGKMEIKAIDNFLNKLPDAWSETKKDLAKIGLEALRSYDYTSGKLDLGYQDPTSNLILDLDGKQGKRHFELFWRREGNSDNNSSQPKEPDLTLQSKIQP